MVPIKTISGDMSEVDTDESAGFDNFMDGSRGSELMESLRKVCVHIIIIIVSYHSR